MTNEERINLRERAYRLANELVAHLTDVEGITREAEVIYRFLLGDSEISEPEKSRNEWKHVSEISPSEYQRIHADLHGIDWSRPQLVINDSNGLIVKVSDAKGHFSFSGTVMEPGLTTHAVGDLLENYWYRWDFRYYGEIPEESQKTTGLNFLEAMRLLSDGLVVNRNSKTRNYGPYRLYGKRIGIASTSTYTASFDIDDILATDWEIVKQH